MNRGLIFAAALAMLLFHSTVYGQNELVAGYGLFSSGEIDNAYFHSDIKQVVNFNDKYRAFPKGIGPWVLGYNYSVSNSLAIGVVGVVSVTRVSYYGEKAENGTLNDSKQVVVSNQYSSLIRVFYYWMNIKRLTVYSGIAGGVGYQTYRNNTENLAMNKLAMAYHASILGVRAGTRLGAFFELGYGYAGVANVGVSLYF